MTGFVDLADELSGATFATPLGTTIHVASAIVSHAPEPCPLSRARGGEEALGYSAGRLPSSAQNSWWPRSRFRQRLPRHAWHFCATLTEGLTNYGAMSLTAW